MGLRKKHYIALLEGLQVITDALHRLRTYPRVGKGKDAHVSTNLIFAGGPPLANYSILGLRELAVFNETRRKPRPVAVDTTSLIPTQHGIFFKKLELELQDTVNKPITVWHPSGSYYYYVLDGHHRAAAAILTGQPTVKAYVIETS